MSSAINKACDEKNKKQLELKLLTREYRDKVKECEESLYGSFITEYFKLDDVAQLTHNDLLRGLFNYYKKEKKKRYKLCINISTIY